LPQIAVALYSSLDIALDAATETVCAIHQSGFFHIRTTPVLPTRLTQHRPKTERSKSLHTLAYTLPSRPLPSPPSSSRCPVIPTMPFRPQHSLVMIDVDKMHTIDTRSVEDLFGMWSGTIAANVSPSLSIVADTVQFLTRSQTPWRTASG
jgi:hypothetical protein